MTEESDNQIDRSETWVRPQRDKPYKIGNLRILYSFPYDMDADDRDMLEEKVRSALPDRPMDLSSRGAVIEYGDDLETYLNDMWALAEAGALSKEGWTEHRHISDIFAPICHYFPAHKVVTDLLGLAPDTVERWASYIGNKSYGHLKVTNARISADLRRSDPESVENLKLDLIFDTPLYGKDLATLQEQLGGINYADNAIHIVYGDDIKGFLRDMQKLMDDGILHASTLQKAIGLKKGLAESISAVRPQSALAKSLQPEQILA